MTNDETPACGFAPAPRPPAESERPATVSSFVIRAWSVFRHWSLVIRHFRRWAVRLALAYAGVVLVMLALENFLVYHGTPADRDWLPPPTDAVRDVELTSADGTRLHAWWLPGPGDGAVLHCHGNAGNLSHRGPSLPRWRHETGLSVLIIDYPGYGKCGGSPTEAGCYAAADAGYDWLVHTAKVAPQRIVLFGDSLGGGVATDLAARRPHRALVLVRTFTSLPDTAAAVYPWLPVRLLMRNRYDNLSKIARVPGPVFVAHGTADTLVPLAQGERLFAAAPEPKAFVRLEGADHNDPLGADFFAGLRRFLADTEKRP
jgi:uncharacterized protein